MFPDLEYRTQKVPPQIKRLQVNVQNRVLNSQVVAVEQSFVWHCDIVADKT